MLRKDYFLDRWVYYAVKRGKRPHEFVQSPQKISKNKICAFCPGNEKATPKEIGRLEYKGTWKMRWFPNKFSAVELTPKQPPKNPPLFIEQPALGKHEVIVETNHHKTQLWDMPPSHIRELLEVIRVRVAALHQIKGINYVSVFKNNGPQGGTSLAHSHTQLIGLGHVPPLVSDEIAAQSSYQKKHHRCGYCTVIKKESQSRRCIAQNNGCIAFAPFASRFEFEAWIFPLRHITSFEQLEHGETAALADMIQKILTKLKSINASYNLYFHYAPFGKDLHFHVEITPRLSTWAGFELSTHCLINPVLPEKAAQFYRRNYK